MTEAEDEGSTGLYGRGSIECLKHKFGRLYIPYLKAFQKDLRWDNPGEEMAAGQQKRRLNGVCGSLSNSIQELHAGKRKINLEISRWYRRMRPHIALDWDEDQKKAVAQHAQVGILWWDLLPFSESSHCHSCRDLADVFIVPEELYDLKDIKDVLSYKVWQTCLSDSERKLLSQFLPKGIDAERIVHSLLHGENFYFGNPLSSWGSTLCSGGMHPDAVRSRDFDLRVSKKAYYSELQNYHSNMLETLQRWKQTWKSCKNPERELPQQIWRCSETEDAEDAVVPRVKENEDSNQNGRWGVDESFSSIVDGKLHSNGVKPKGDNRMEGSYIRQESVMHCIADLQEALEREGRVFHSQKKENISSDSFKNVEIGDFMFCIKISRKQHADILKMKQTGEELQLESLGAIFGDIKNLNVQSLSSLEASDKKKVQEHWLLLVSRDVPAAYAEFVEGRLQRHACRKSLGKEFLEKQQLVMYKGNSEPNRRDSSRVCGLNEDLQDNEEIDISPTTNLPGNVNDKLEDLEQSYLQSVLADHLSVHVNDNAEDLQQSYSQSALPDPASNTENRYSAKPSNSVDMREPSMGQLISNNKFVPVQTSNICCSPSMRMAPELENAESAVHGSCVLENENPKPGNYVSLELKILQNATSVDREPVCGDDDEMYSIKDVWLPGDSETPNFHFQNALGMPGTETDGSLRKNRANFWEPWKPAQEMCNSILIKESGVKDEPEKRTRFNLEKPGIPLIVEPQQIHTSQSLDQLAKNRKCALLGQTNKKTTTEKCVLHLNEPLSAENSARKLGLQPFAERHNDSSNPHAMSVGMDDKCTHASDLSLRQPEQPEEHRHPLKLENDRFGEPQIQHALMPPFSDHLSKNVAQSNMQSKGGNSVFISSPNVIQATERRTNFNQVMDQILHDHILPSELLKGQNQQAFQHVSSKKQELQFLAGSKPAEQECQFQHRELIQSVMEEGLNDHLQEQQAFRQSQQDKNQPYVFHHSQQNQHFQHSIQQDLFCPGLSPAVVPSWCGPVQVTPCRPLSMTTMPQFSPQSVHWNGNENRFHSNWSHPELMQSPSIPAHGHASSDNEGKFFGMLPQWDRLPQSTYGTLNHDPYGSLKSHVNAGTSASDDCQGQDNWTQFQYSDTNNPHSYLHEKGSTYRPNHIPWLNTTSTSSNPQTTHFRQQISGLQDPNGQRPCLKSSWNL